jgi:hypothetical protein
MKSAERIIPKIQQSKSGRRLLRRGCDIFEMKEGVSMFLTYVARRGVNESMIQLIAIREEEARQDHPSSHPGSVSVR